MEISGGNVVLTLEDETEIDSNDHDSFKVLPENTLIVFKCNEGPTAKQVIMTEEAEPKQVAAVLPVKATNICQVMIFYFVFKLVFN